PLPADLVACGEVGLGGELRQVAHTSRRLAEAGRIGFATALVPRSAPDGPAGIELVRVGTVAEAVDHLGLTGQPASRPRLTSVPSPSPATEG
ncbi:MAG TPA: hypothetical protein VGM93_06290, partial [Acidimicrobiales bacterium]